MLHSRSLASIDCNTKSIVFSLCLTGADLRALGFEGSDGLDRGVSEELWARVGLHRGCHTSEALARAVSDVLDLRYVDTIAKVRSLSEEALAGMVRTWIEHRDELAIPGLLWALCTDARPAVHQIGLRFAQEAVTFACLQLLEGAPSTASTRFS